MMHRESLLATQCYPFRTEFWPFCDVTRINTFYHLSPQFSKELSFDALALLNLTSCF